jgi:hypothetical protein
MSSNPVSPSKQNSTVENSNKKMATTKVLGTSMLNLVTGLSHFLKHKIAGCFQMT